MHFKFLQPFEFKCLFSEEDFMEGSMLHESEKRHFEKGECFKKAGGINSYIRSIS